MKTSGRGFEPDEAIGIFHSHDPSGRSTALGSTQPLTDMSKGKGPEWPRGFQEAKVPRLHNNGTGWR